MGSHVLSIVQGHYLVRACSVIIRWILELIHSWHANVNIKFTNNGSLL